MPIFLYGLGVCAFTKINLQWLVFTVNGILMKLSKISNIEIVNKCKNFFGIELLSVQPVKRFDKFCAMKSLE